MSGEVDVAATPALNGILAPIADEIDAPLEVVEGELPAELHGAYLRNGPNPRFTPIGSYTYPLDGDGMVHGVWFEDGRAHYRNRFVRTPALEAEEKAGRALWPGVMTGELPSADEVGPDLAGTERDLVDINVVRHAGRLLALAEGARPFELTADLATVGPHDFGGGLPDGLCAHPKIDPVTGEMVVFRYGFAAEPWLTWAVVAADGTMAVPETTVEVAGPMMIHDCAITASHLVLFVCPLRFDFDAVMRGESLLQWEPERGTEVLAIARDGGAVTRFRADPFWVWHVANAFDDGSGGGRRIVVDYPVWSHPGMGLVPAPASGGVVRATLDLDAGTATFDQRDDQLAEFPRIDDRRIGGRHGWFHVAAKDPDHPTDVAGEWNRLLRYDLDRGVVQELRGGERCFGEAVFAPRQQGSPADDGYLLTYVYERGASTTDLLVLDGADITAAPVARLRVPHRVPFGLHGSWLPGG